MKSKTLTSRYACSHCFCWFQPPVLWPRSAGQCTSAAYSTIIPLGPTVKGSPWEMHGQWSMDLHPEWGTADFSRI